MDRTTSWSVGHVWALAWRHGVGERGERHLLGRVAVVGLAALLGMVALLAIAACGQTDEESPPAGQLAAAVTTSAAQSACDKVALASNTGPTGPYASPA